MFCRICGKEIKNEARFCKWCGSAVKIPTSVSVIDEQEEKLITEELEADTRASDDQLIPNAEPEHEKFPEESCIGKRKKDLPNSSGTSPKQKKKYNKKKRWVPIVILAILVVIAAFVVLNTNFNLGLWIPSAKENSNLAEQVEIDESMLGTCYSLTKEQISIDEETGLEYVNDILVVYMENEYTEQNLQQLLFSVNGKIVGSIPTINQYQIQISKNDLENLNSLCSYIQSIDYVKDARIDYIENISTNVEPEDPWNESLVFGERVNEQDPNENNWWIEAIYAPSAWAYNEFYSNIKIGVIDDGIDLNHEDLSGIQVISQNYNVEDHGTHVAGIIAATPNNRVGISGIVWNSTMLFADWDEEKKLGIEKYTSTTIENETVNLISVYGAKVINNSFGLRNCSYDDGQIVWEEWSPQKSLSAAEEVARRQSDAATRVIALLLDQGYSDFILVQSAGNDNIESKYNGWYSAITRENFNNSYGYSYEEIISHVIVVGAAKNNTDNSYLACDFSNYGETVSIFAPGENIYSTISDGYGMKSGTSMAAPIVSGVTSLVWSVNPELSAYEVKNIVCDSKNTMYDVTGKDETYRMVNAKLAVEAALETIKDRDIAKNPLAGEKEKQAGELHFSGMILSPEDVVLKMYDALKAGEYEKAASCLDPAVEREIGFWGRLISAIVSLFTGEYMSWGQLLLEEAGAQDVTVIECYSRNLVFESSLDFLSDIIERLPFVNNLICTEADVHVKFRYNYNGETRIMNETYHVRRFSGAGWRIDQELN